MLFGVMGTELEESCSMMSAQLTVHGKVGIMLPF